MGRDSIAVHGARRRSMHRHTHDSLGLSEKLTPMTVSPTATTGRAGTPKCWRTGSTRTGGIGALCKSPGRDKALRSGRVNASVNVMNGSHAASRVAASVAMTS